MGLVWSHGGTLGTCVGTQPSGTCCIPLLCHSQRVGVHGLFGFFLSFLSTHFVLFFSFIKSHMYFEFLWCHLFSGAFSVQSSYFLYYLSQ